MRIRSTLIVALLSSVHALAAELSIDPAADKVINQLVARVESAESIAGELKTTERVFSNDQVVFEQKTNYLTAAAVPNKFALRVSSEQINAQVVSDGKLINLLIAPEAYVQKDSPATLAEVLSEDGVPSGPLIDLMMILAVPAEGVRERLLEGVKQVSLSAKAGTETQTLKIEQENGNILDLELTTGEFLDIKSMKVDMSAKIKRENPQVQETPGFRFEVTVEVASWKWELTDDEVFTFDPPKDAKAYASIEGLIKAMSGGPHPLLGKAAPDFEVALMDDSKIKLSQHEGKEIVILDFWATWCGPCRMAMPVISEVAAKYKEKGVVLYAVNNAETKPEIQAFLDESKLPITVARDEDQSIARTYGVTGLPMTVLIGKDGLVENIHLGFQSLEGLREQLTGELDVLVDGGHLFEAESE